MPMAGVAALIVAAGRGLRAGGTEPKQFRALAGQSALRMSLRAFAEHPEVGMVQPVIHADDETRYAQEIAGLSLLPAASGRATRQGSVLAGLEALASTAPDIVLVHDAARPFASPSLISRSIAAASQFGAAIPALEVTDAVKLVDGADAIAESIERSRVRLVQTPQAFKFAPLYDAHRKAAAAGRDDFPDDAALAQWAGMKVNVFKGEHSNIKLTTPDDFVRAETRMLRDVRTGTGIDVHAFAPGDHVTLGGMPIPHDRALSGHSDADVVLHALVDAILGALADGDIGVHFPPSDQQWRGAASDRFVQFAMDRLAKRGGRISHIDINIVCESPKIGPHRDAMRARVAELCAVNVDRVAIKATTSEGLGFTGRGEGIAAFVTATVRLPFSRD
ncbi:MAG TPA: bifunctional 2-C-methyl-D-erythritol 4-phosphate cytidylyltransferase/2-C-methyl-D-erythritol 2,4-cyclodiphosphate synthase [Pseudolabrys sp.]|nr:bifunctional 2-C-methyl-D-erythritol 4-phosphate cytidylyltransferase/2-C-methyl-D-erythritol 2,4-cyclodiphosphate synthase [Pseudolabrys sp.]